MTNFDVYLADAKTVAIAGHVRPDGDCAGSCLATYNYIKNYFPHVKVDLYLEPIPNIFKFMKRSEEILSEWPDDRKYDLFIAQDCGDAKRLGNAAKYFESAEHTICVDHHVSNQNFAEHNYIFPDASSTCELIFELLPDERIDREIAECIYTGMVHDTGVFQYSCTSRKTMEIAGKLIEKGINFPKIVDETFFTKTYNQNRIMGLALPCEITEFFSIDFQRRVHRWDLHIVPHKRKDCLPHGFLCHLHIFLLQHCTGDILGICHLSQ